MSRQDFSCNGCFDLSNRGFFADHWSHMNFDEGCALEEYAFLFGICALLRPMKILEVGTSTGLGTAAMWLGASLTGLRPKIVTIDHKHHIFEKNLSRFKVPFEFVDFRHGKSSEILQSLLTHGERFDLCFIDGGHTPEIVREDWRLTSKLSEMWLFHDLLTESGVQDVVESISMDSNYQVFPLLYPAGHKVDEETGEWYRSLDAAGFCLVQGPKISESQKSHA